MRLPKQENFETNQLTLSEAPSPLELEAFYKREAIAIVTCKVRHGTSCEHRAIAQTEVDSNQADTLCPLGPSTPRCNSGCTTNLVVLTSS